MSRTQGEQGFSSFFAKFLMIFQSGAHRRQNGKSLAKNEEKPCSTCIQPIIQGPLQNPNFIFENLVHH